MGGRCYDRAIVSSFGEYDRTPLGRFLRLVMRSFPLGRWFGVQVRMYHMAALLMPLLFLLRVRGGTAVETLVLAAICFVGLFVVIWSHEMGHIAAGWRHRIRTDLITLSPLGGIAHMNAPARSPREEIAIALAGPAVHLAWLGVFWPLQQLLPAQVLAIDGWFYCPIEYAVWYLVTVNASLLVFNLLPFFPLDGGRVLRALLALRVHPNRATMWATSVGIVGGIVLVTLGFLRRELESTILVVLGLSNISASLQERRMAKHVLVYQQGPPREVWEMDPDAWKHGAAADEREPRERRPGALARWSAERAAKKARDQAADDAELDRQVDEVLARVKQVGLDGLEAREKAILQRAARRRRETG